MVREGGTRYAVINIPATERLMKFFIDTADVKEIREAASMGLVDGVPTNPSLVARTGRKFKDVLLEICDLVEGPVSAAVVSTTHDEMMKEAREYAALRSNIVVKIPLLAEGLKAVRTCTNEGIKTNVTPRPERRTALHSSAAWTISRPTACS